MLVLKSILKSNSLLLALIKLNLLFIFCINESRFDRPFFEGHETKSNFEDVFENTPSEAGPVALGIFYSLFVYGGW